MPTKAKQRDYIEDEAVPCIVIGYDFACREERTFPEWYDSTQPDMLDAFFFNTILIDPNDNSKYYIVQSIDMEFKTTNEQGE